MKEGKLKLLVLTTWADDWNLERVRGSPESAYVFRALKDVGVSVTLIAPKGEREESEDEEYRVFRVNLPTVPRIKYLRFVANVVFYLLLNLRYYRIARRLLKKESYDGLLSLAQIPAPATYLLGRKFGLPSLLKIPGVVFLNARLSPIKYFLLNWVFLIAFRLPFEKFILVDDGSQGDKAAKRLGVPEEKIVFLPNPAPVLSQHRDREKIREKLKIEPEIPLLGWIGRFDPLKGVRWLPEILKKISQKTPEAHFLIVGSGPWENEIKKALKPLEKRIYYTGSLTYFETQEIIGAIDVLLSTNIYANYTLPVLEAMSHGIPVVAWDVGDSWKAVREGETGFLISPWDVDDMVEKVTRLLNDKNLREKMGREAREFVENSFPQWPERAHLEANIIKRTLEEWNQKRPR